VKAFFASRTGMIVTGVLIGGMAVVLQKLGNPANMGLCMACFERDIAGALGLHQAAVVQYVRPEIIGIVWGALLAAFAYGEFKPRSGSAAVVRFFLGGFAMIGALVFLGCPWRAFLRLAGGDLNAVLGILGLAFGVFVGAQFLKRGYSLGRSQPAEGGATGWILPGALLFLLVLVVMQFSGLKASTEGPGSLHAPLGLSLAAGVIIGGLAQRSRFCTVGALRDLFIVRDLHLLYGVVGFTVAAFVLNLVLGQFKVGFAGQPIAHTVHAWNFLGMTLAGFAFSLAGGCPGRQLILSGEGDGDAAVFVLGMFAGAAFAHNWGLASSPKGVGANGPAAVVIGLVFCLVVALVMTRRRAPR
jgi:uncharacterized protein